LTSTVRQNDLVFGMRSGFISRSVHTRLHRSRGTTVNAVPIPAVAAVFVIKFNPITVVVPSSPSPCSCLLQSTESVCLLSSHEVLINYIIVC